MKSMKPGSAGLLLSAELAGTFFAKRSDQGSFTRELRF
jgi:hypothetical protein